MTEQQAWLCPGCGKWHAPFVTTCPEVAMQQVVTIPIIWVQDCGCPPSPGTCSSTSCPRRPKPSSEVTCAGYGEKVQQ